MCWQLYDTAVGLKMLLGQELVLLNEQSNSNTHINGLELPLEDKGNSRHTKEVSELPFRHGGFLCRSVPANICAKA